MALDAAAWITGGATSIRAVDALPGETRSTKCSSLSTATAVCPFQQPITVTNQLPSIRPVPSWLFVVTQPFLRLTVIQLGIDDARVALQYQAVGQRKSRRMVMPSVKPLERLDSDCLLPPSLKSQPCCPAVAGELKMSNRVTPLITWKSL